MRPSGLCVQFRKVISTVIQTLFPDMQGIDKIFNLKTDISVAGQTTNKCNWSQSLK
jgi:hypothetical protein